MANSRLAHLYSRIRGSLEDVAAVSLQYLLTQSRSLNLAFTKLISKHFAVSLPDTMQYSCQSVGEDKERPDMSGSDEHGNEKILYEMKFYAGLTANQPLC